MWRFIQLSVLCGGLCSCTPDDEIIWAQFNGDNDQLAVDVRPGDIDDAELIIDLLSNTETEIVGTAAMSPTAGPVGTDHFLMVVIAESYVDIVGRASIQVDSGERGIVEYDMIQDSANAGAWVLTMTSLGDEMEVRTDIIQLLLWDEVEQEEPDNEPWSLF